MSKDPATLWYWNDWITGVMTLTRHQKGCYMDLLGAQFNEGRLSLEQIKNVLGNDFAVWGVLSKKFKQDSNGLFYNEKAEETLNKRRKFTTSRKENLKKGPHMDSHMGNENEIIIDNINLINKYGQEMISDFLRYWNEPNKKGKRRWELQDTWSLEGRLVTWEKNSEKFNGVVKKESKSDLVIKNTEEILRSINNE